MTKLVGKKHYVYIFLQEALCYIYLMNIYTRDPKAVNVWQKGADETISEIGQGETTWLPADSLLRPNNLNLWLSLKQAEPDYSFNAPKGYDQLMQYQSERAERAKKSNP